MKSGKYLAFGLALSVLPVVFVQNTATPQDMLRPKMDIPKQTTSKQTMPKRTVSKQRAPRPALSKQVLGKKQPLTEPLAFDPASKTTFISYDIGTLRMIGKSPSDATFTIGTLRMTGRTGVATYAIGTLSMSGMREP